MRTRSGRLDLRELDVGAGGKRGVRRQRRPEPLKRAAIGQRVHERHALRIAHAERRHAQRLAGDVERLSSRTSVGWPIAARNV